MVGQAAQGRRVDSVSEANGRSPARRTSRTWRRLTVMIPRTAVATVAMDERTPYLDNIFIWERRRRRGFASALVVWLTREGGEPIEIDVSLRAPVMRRLVARLGYVETGPSRRYSPATLWAPPPVLGFEEVDRLEEVNRVWFDARRGRTLVIYCRPAESPERTVPGPTRSNRPRRPGRPRAA